MNYLTRFFETANEIDHMANWKDNAPVSEFWEAWSNAAQEATDLIAERDALRKLVEDLKLGAECYLTAVADLQAGYTPDTHPDWNAVQYLAGEAHAAILRANDVLGVDAGDGTTVGVK